MEPRDIPTEDDRAKLRFRALTVNGTRRGIRLEQIYWDVLQAMATKRGWRLGDIIRDCETQLDDGANITAALRVKAVAYLADELEASAAETRPSLVMGLVAACPSPAIALSGEKKIITYNQPFLAFLHARLSRIPLQALSKDFRLLIDTPFAGLLDKLRATPETAISTGFSITANDQVFRGRMNTVLVGTKDKAAVIGYVIP